MARDYARFLTRMWNDADWRAMDDVDQHLYFLLATQQLISAAGVLLLQERQWARMAANTKPDDIMSKLQRLDDHEFIVADFDTDEILVRAFVRIDGGFTNPKRRPTIIRDAESIISQRARRVLNGEFERCGLPLLTIAMVATASPIEGVSDSASHTLSAGLPDTVGDSVSDTVYPLESDDYTPESSQVDRLSHRVSDRDAPAEGRVPNTVFPSPEAKEQTPPPPAARRPKGADVARGLASTAHTPRAFGIVKSYLDSMAGPVAPKVRAALGPEVDQLLDAGFTEETVRLALVEMARQKLGPPMLQSIAHNIANQAPLTVKAAVVDDRLLEEYEINRLIGREEEPDMPRDMVARADRDEMNAWRRATIQPWRDDRQRRAKAKRAEGARS